MLKSLIRRVSTVVVQQFCKLLVGGSNPSPGTIFPRHSTRAHTNHRCAREWPLRTADKTPTKDA